MIAKLYKGPKHNKTFQVPDDERVIFVTAPISRYSVYEHVDGEPPRALYKKGIYERTNHTHPSGAVFFVWKGWQ